MSDVRALLKAKRQEIRVNHPLASYTASGQLRCIACGIIVKQTASWEGHIGSKGHRTHAARLREQERLRELQEQEQHSREKRRASEVDSEDEDEPEAKRARVDEADGEQDSLQPASRSRSAGFPADFFSDASRAPLPPPSDDEDDEEQVPTTAVPPSAIDLEWQKFQEAVINVPEQHEAYDRATVMAEPVLAVEATGFPGGTLDEGEGVREPGVLDEGELRRQKEQEERELIMDRLLDEERAQEEADAKVTVLKSRLEALKKQREAARKVKAISTQNQR